MISVTQISTWGFQHAIRGMRNPMNSWDKSDSIFVATPRGSWELDRVGENDLRLMHSLYKAGTDHRKYLRQMFVSMDINAPLYWWKEFDTYKVGTVSNSCSTMHKLTSKRLELQDFSVEHLDDNALPTMENLIALLNLYISAYEIDHDKKLWYQIIQMLPSSYNQKRTITMTYENAVTMIHARGNHKLDEWKILCDILHHSLPYLADIIGD